MRLTGTILNISKASFKSPSYLSHNRMSSITAGCIIIGDEVLNGKIKDTNSHTFAKYCYDLGIQLKEVATVADDEEQIVETVRRFSKKYNFTVTTGGIGPTHDDITYEAIAKSFNLNCELNVECQDRMKRVYNAESRLNEQALRDHYRMATLPSGPNVKNYYVSEKLWVPICSIEHRIYIFPGIPQLFNDLITQFIPTVKQIYGIDESNQKFIRFFVKTSMSESQISQFLRILQEEASTVSKNIKIGSYPHFGMGFNTVSIFGITSETKYLIEIKNRAIKELDGEEVSAEYEESISNNT